ncbi:MAG TPA: hypothetical protein VII73_06150 [Caulobacteraceae bacterium]
MKLLTLAAASLVGAVFIGGTLAAQTMEPVANPADSGHHMMDHHMRHHHMRHHHMMHHHMMKHHMMHHHMMKHDGDVAPH